MVCARVSNLCERLWSSNLEDGGRLGFVLNVYACDASGARLCAGQARLPFVLPPGWKAILSVALPRARGGAALVFEAGQNDETGAFQSWGESLRVAL